MDSFEVEGHQMGAQVYISVDGVCRLDAAFGRASASAAMNPDTLMRWYCAVKPVVAFAVCQSFEQQGLSIHHPVVDFVPAYGRHGKDRFTVADLLCHNVPYAKDTGERALPSLDHRTILDAICSAPVRQTGPGPRDCCYSRTNNYYLLGEVIRVVDGRHAADYLRDEVFVPLGMHDTWATLDRARLDAYGHTRLGTTHIAKPRRSGGYKMRPITAANRADVVGFSVPGGSTWGPAHDLGRFYEEMVAALRGVSEAVPSDIARRMVSPRHMVRRYQPQQSKLARGLGFQRMMWPWFGFYMSFTTFGHEGYCSSVAFADPDLGLVLVYVPNGLLGSGASYPRWRNVANTVYRDLGFDVRPYDRAVVDGRSIPYYVVKDPVVPVRVHVE